jgi:AcrR family transcriptional regulator
MLQRKGTEKTDGRRVRGADNRRKIVEALLKLVEAGNPVPNAEQVADEAGVALRTVFRHFADMDKLYSEVSERMMAEIRPIIERPFEKDDPEERVEELVDRRAQVFERLLPYKHAGDAHRAGSQFLTTEHRALVKMQREALKRALVEMPKSAQAFEALDLLLSIDSWKRLRFDQGLSPREARNVLALAAVTLVSAGDR